MKPASVLFVASLTVANGWFSPYSPAPALAHEYDGDDYDSDDYADPALSDYDSDDYADPALFYGDLSPYGEWVEVRSYGRVWRPRGVRSDWRPYSEGRWEYTEYGWTWISDEPWGWAPYHYGRWFHEVDNGWVWIPGRQWAPAWVVWRRGGGWIGWTPAPPGWGPARVIRYDPRPDYYCFVEERRFTDRRLRDHFIVTRRNPELVRVTRNVTNYTVVENHVHNHSIDVADVEKVAGHPVRRHRVEEFEQAVPRHVARREERKAGEEHGDQVAPEHGRRDVRPEPPVEKRHGAAFDRTPDESPMTRHREETRGQVIEDRPAERRDAGRHAVERHDAESRATERQVIENRDSERREGERRKAAREAERQMESHPAPAPRSEVERPARIERKSQRAPRIEQPREERRSNETRVEVESRQTQRSGNRGPEHADKPVEKSQHQKKTQDRSSDQTPGKAHGPGGRATD